MIQKSLIILGSLTLTASAMALPRHEPDVSFLSDKAKAVLTQIKGLHEKIHARVEAAADDNAEKTWKDLGRSLHETCLIGPGPGGHRPPPPPPLEEADAAQKSGERRGPPPLTAEKKQEFETKLTSEACSQAIANAQGKLQ